MRFQSLQRRWLVQSSDFQGVSRIGRCMRTRRAWDDYAMQKNVEMGPAGSITIAILVIAVTLLMRSFYKRFMGVDRSDDTTDK
jgi:hypothetical protein